MRVVPIRYSADVDAAVRFYRAVGLEVGARSRPGGWVELPAAAGMLAIHRAGTDETGTDDTGVDVAGRCELAFEADEPLAEVAERLRRAGFRPGPVIDENHGQSLRVRDPDGVWVQINRYDRELYT